MQIETSTRPEFDSLIEQIGAAMNNAHRLGHRRGQAAFNALFHLYPELANAIRNLDKSIMDADPFYVPDSRPGDAIWDNFWYVIRRAYGVAD